MLNGSATDELTGQIEHAVKVARMSEQWRSMYMKERALYMDLKEEGQLEATFRYVSKGWMTSAQAADELHITVEDFENQMKEAGYSIPDATPTA